MPRRVYQFGEVVTALAFGNEQVKRRVWEHIRKTIFICTEAEYQRTRQLKDTARTVGFQQEDIIDVHPAGSIAD